MQGHNPIVQDSPKETLNSIINVLQYLTTTFDQLDDKNTEVDDEELLNASDIQGLCRIVDCVKDAAETCYAQLLNEKPF
ncbi:MAG: hypothetical protein MJK04_20055 [Psychrosphaera sp.]|nr:hypothetical protein [Psychrosphaera sp.]